MSARQRRKGIRTEAEVVKLHADIGIEARRTPFSGGLRHWGEGHDVDLYIDGADAAPLVAEVKARRTGSGFTTIEKWLGQNDLLFLRRNGRPPLILMPWSSWVGLLQRVRK